MHPLLRSFLAILAGIIVGSIVNMGIITISESIIPPPEGLDNTNMESLKASMHLFEARHFIFPFLAHAIGTFVGAYIAALIVKNNKIKFALGVGVFFLLGGIYMAVLLPAPTWFIVVDIALAYLPVAWLAGTMAQTRP